MLKWFIFNLRTHKSAGRNFSFLNMVFYVVWTLVSGFSSCKLIWKINTHNQHRKGSNFAVSKQLTIVYFPRALKSKKFNEVTLQLIISFTLKLHNYYRMSLHLTTYTYLVQPVIFSLRKCRVGIHKAFLFKCFWKTRWKNNSLAMQIPDYSTNHSFGFIYIFSNFQEL